MEPKRREPSSDHVLGAVHSCVISVRGIKHSTLQGMLLLWKRAVIAACGIMMVGGSPRTNLRRWTRNDHTVEISRSLHKHLCYNTGGGDSGNHGVGAVNWIEILLRLLAYHQWNGRVSVVTQYGKSTNFPKSSNLSVISEPEYTNPLILVNDV